MAQAQFHGHIYFTELCFNHQSPDDVPIPGGTVYVRQRECQHPGGTASNTVLHQHVRRFIIPKDAYRVAVRSLSAMDARMEDRVSTPNSHVSNSRNSLSRPYSSSTRRTSQTNVTPQTSMTSHSRIQSAPPRRTTSAWSWLMEYYYHLKNHTCRVVPVSCLFCCISYHIIYYLRYVIKIYLKQP